VVQSKKVVDAGLRRHDGLGAGMTGFGVVQSKKVVDAGLCRHDGLGAGMTGFGVVSKVRKSWMPAFAGMTGLARA
jgi:hypothetical protein